MTQRDFFNLSETEQIYYFHKNKKSLSQPLWFINLARYVSGKTKRLDLTHGVKVKGLIKKL